MMPTWELEERILFLKWSGIADSAIQEGLENPLSKEGRRFSKKEIEKAFQNLQTAGLIDKEGLITENGISTIETL